MAADTPLSHLVLLSLTILVMLPSPILPGPSGTMLPATVSSAATW
jgi:hypothetical protein